MYSLRLAAWGPSGESQKPVEAADATVATPKLRPQVCSIVPRTRHGPEKSNMPRPAAGPLRPLAGGTCLGVFSRSSRSQLRDTGQSEPGGRRGENKSRRSPRCCPYVCVVFPTLVDFAEPSNGCFMWSVSGLSLQSVGKAGGDVLTASSHDLNPPTGVRSHPSWSFSTPVFQGPPKLWPLPQL